MSLIECTTKCISVLYLQPKLGKTSLIILYVFISDQFATTLINNIMYLAVPVARLLLILIKFLHVAFSFAQEQP